jgi:hypothetical protein
VNAKGIDSLGYAELVGDGEVDAFTLAAVAQGRIVYFHFGFHASMSLTRLSQQPSQRNGIFTLAARVCKVQIGYAAF